MDEIDELAALIIRQSGIPAQFAPKATHDELSSMIRALVARREAAAAEAMREAAADCCDAISAAIWRRMEGLTASFERDLKVELEGQRRELKNARKAILALPLPDAAPEPQALRVPEGWRGKPMTETVRTVDEGERQRLQQILDEQAERIARPPAPPSDGGKE